MNEQGGGRAREGGREGTEKNKKKKGMGDFAALCHFHLGHN